MRVFSISIIFVLIFVFGVAIAQDTTLPPNTCTQEDYLQLQTEMAELTELLADIETNEPEAIFLQMRQTLDTYQLNCTGFFSGETHSNGIIGPLTFDGTLYQITFTLGEGQFVVGSTTYTEISGDCGFNFGALLTDAGSETDVLEIGEDCEMLIEVDANSDWTLSFTKLR